MPRLYDGNIFLHVRTCLAFYVRLALGVYLARGQIPVHRKREEKRARTPENGGARQLLGVRSFCGSKSYVMELLSFLVQPLINFAGPVLDQ